MAYPTLFRSGGSISHDPADVRQIMVYPGEFRDGADTADINAWPYFAPIVKKCHLNWVAGTNQGCLAPGVTYNQNSWYFVYIVLNPTTGVVDIVTMPTINSTISPTGMAALGFTKWRLIGAVHMMVNRIQPIDMRNYAPGAMKVTHLQIHDYANGLDVPNYDLTPVGNVNLAVNVPPMGPYTYANVPFYANVRIFHPTQDSGVLIAPGQAYSSVAPSLTVAPLCNLTCKAGIAAYAHMSLLADYNQTVNVRGLVAGTIISIHTMGYDWPSGWLF